jgi:hypothetical protein
MLAAVVTPSDRPPPRREVDWATTLHSACGTSDRNSTNQTNLGGTALINLVPVIAASWQEANQVRRGVTVQTRLSRLIDAIDQLVDEQLARGETGYDLGQDRCELCGGPWHGAPSQSPTEREDLLRRPRCPGAFADDAQREQWQRDRRRGRRLRRVPWPLRGGRWHAERGGPGNWRSNRRHSNCRAAFATDEQREHADGWAIIVPVPGLPFPF